MDARVNAPGHTTVLLDQGFYKSQDEGISNVTPAREATSEASVI